MENNRPERKKNRLSDFDYATPTSYFITICTSNRQNLFWTETFDGTLSEVGNIAEREIKEIPMRFALTNVDRYIIMPDHVHLMITLYNADPEMRQKTPNIQNIVGSFKAKVTSKSGCGKSIWQKSFYDRIIRNETEYVNIWQYIENNPHKYFNNET